MSGGSKTTTTKTEEKRDPWAPAQPALQEILGGASAAYKSGAGQQVYQGERVAGLGDETKAGLGYLADNAGAGLSGTKAGEAFNTGLLSSGGQTAGTAQAADAFSTIPSVSTRPTMGLLGRMASPGSLGAVTARKLADGSYGIDTEADYRGMLAGAAGPTQTKTSLQAVADGKFLDGANPYLDDIVSRSNNAAASQVAERFAASGRYGSGMMSNALADAVSANESRLRYQDYDAERARQAQAASAIDAAGLAQSGQVRGLLDAIGGVQAQNAGLVAQGAQLGMAQDAQALAAAGQLGSQQAQNASIAQARASGLAGIASGDRAAAQGALSSLSTIEDGLLAPGRTLAQVGAVQDAARQDAINADMARFTEENNAPWTGLGLYSSLAAPIAGLGGTSSGTSTQQQPQPGLLQTILGGAIGLSGAAANLGKAAPFFAMMSDERAKEDIRPVGMLNDGQTVYAYRYKGDPTPQIGLLAQEVAAHEPDAVAQGPHGLLMVDYDRATRHAAAR